MNVLSLLWVLTVVILPFLLIIVWGLRIAFHASFSYQFGLGLTMIGLFTLGVFLGFTNWYGHNWHMTGFTKFCFITAGVSASLYCLIVIFLPSYFTYNGTTAILLSFNFMAASHLIYSKVMNKLLDINNLIMAFCSNDKFYQSRVD